MHLMGLVVRAIHTAEAMLPPDRPWFGDIIGGNGRGLDGKFHSLLDYMRDCLPDKQRFDTDIWANGIAVRTLPFFQKRRAICHRVSPGCPDSANGILLGDIM